MPLGANKAAIMGVAGVSTGDVVLLSSQTATSDAAITFSSDITSTYGEYIFRFYNMNPETQGAEFQFGINDTADDGGDYDQSEITSTYYLADHREDNAGSPTVYYTTAYDQANVAGEQIICDDIGSGADESCAGELHLFNPSSTTYVKHFMSRFNGYHHPGAVSGTKDVFVSGYINVTEAVDDIRFKFSAGDFDGKIKMWGVK
jgi:hypothetical protein